MEVSPRPCSLGFRCAALKSHPAALYAQLFVTPSTFCGSITRLAARSRPGSVMFWCPVNWVWMRMVSRSDTTRICGLVRAVLHPYWHCQSPEKVPRQGAARRQWPRSLPRAGTPPWDFFGAPFGRAAKGPSALLHGLVIARYACAQAPSSWPLGNSLKAPIRVKHCTDARL